MPTNQTKPKKQYESGHAKTAESLGKLAAFSSTLDQTRLDPPPALTLTALNTAHQAAESLQQAVGNSRADWRTIALDRAVDVDKFEEIGAQAVGQLAGRGASREKVKDGRGYVKKLQGKGASAKKKDDPNTPDIDESEEGVSNSQQSSAAQISIFYELVYFLEAQNEYASVKQIGMTIADLRAFVDSVQAKHDLSIAAAAKLSDDRRERNKFFYLNEQTNVCDLGAQFKELVKGAYGANSPEYKTVRAISFKKPKM